MSATVSYRKIMRVLLWLSIGVAIVMLSIAAMRNQREGLCADYIINISSSWNEPFVKKENIEAVVIKITKGKIKQQPKQSFDLSELKNELEKNVWVKRAEVYFDNRNVLHLNIEERSPVARIFTTASSSYYLDNDGMQMPLPNGVAAKVPVFTNFPDRKKMLSKDSALERDVIKVATYINRNDFWSAQIAQIDIVEANEMELIPVVGNHTIKLGTAEDIESKFNRLLVFYQQVLAKGGMDRYKTINVQFAGQVVADKNKEQKANPQQIAENVRRVMKEGSSITATNTIPVAPIIAKPGEEARTEKVDERQLTADSPNPAAANEKPEAGGQKPKAVVKPSGNSN